MSETATQKTTETALYRDASQPIAARVADLVQRMTLEEKTAQLRSIWIAKFTLLLPDGTINPETVVEVIGDGIGFIGRPVDTMGMSVFPEVWHRSREKAIEFVNEVQSYLVERTRLGIPALFHDETAHGFVAGGTTVFPTPTALAGTFDEELVEAVFSIAAREGRSVGSTVSLGPVLDLARDPRWGRVEEYFGEDPFLTGRMGVAAVRGLQGRERPIGPDRMLATLKHFVHATPEGGVNISPAVANERSLRETYLAPFDEVIREADPAFIMPSYNQVNGLPSHANRDLLQRLGRGLLGFEGVYLSDYAAIEHLRDNQRMVADLKEAALLGIQSGVDVDLPDGTGFAFLAELVREGRLEEALIDQAVGRVLATKFEAGLFENPYVHPNSRGYQEPDAVALAKTTAQKALTLLKNDGLLPLDRGTAQRIAVIGPNAEPLYYGNYSGENETGVSVLDGLREAVEGTAVTIEHAEGVRLVTPAPVPTVPSRMKYVPVDDAENRRLIEEAVALAETADIVFLVLGDHPAITRETTRPAYAGDRSELGLFGLQDELVDAVLALGKPVAALLINGRPIATNRLAADANALLEGWYLGQATGTAVADALFGVEEPGGRLPISIPRSVGSLPVYYNRHTSATVFPYVEGDRSPLFPFGHGLGYTSFEIAAPVLEEATVAVGDSIRLSVQVTNTGTRRGDEVVQLYVRDDLSSVPRPEIELRGFRRVTLDPGSTASVKFVLEPRHLAFWNVDMTERVVEPGTFTISAGRSSAEFRSTSLTVVPAA